jgi:hypothetical protein
MDFLAAFSKNAFNVNKNSQIETFSIRIKKWPNMGGGRSMDPLDPLVPPALETHR